MDLRTKDCLSGVKVTMSFLAISTWSRWWEGIHHQWMVTMTVIVNGAMKIVAVDPAKDNQVYLPSPLWAVLLHEDFQEWILTAALLMCQVQLTVLAADQHRGHHSRLQLHPSAVQG
jgi:hypothetical protein